jgi:outer membrane receptor protein involved in Fe transport
VFQTPASENLLLSSSFSAQHLTSDTAGLPVPPSWANFFEVGISKELWARSLLDVSWFERNGDNFADDDVFLNTGISFPIAFSRAHIYGAEAKLRLPTWKRFSAEGAYSYLVGRALLPVTGGLLLEDADTLLNSHYWIPITQDQRNTANLNVRYQVHPRLWFSILQYYASGLPFQDVQQEGTDPRILAAVNLDRGRVRPFYSLDMQCGAELIKNENRELTLEGSVFNVFDRLHVIDFAGALSDTALGLPRSYSLTLRFRNRH